MKKSMQKTQYWIAQIQFGVQATMVFLSGLAAIFLIMNFLLFERGVFFTVNADFLLFYTTFSAMGCLTLFVLDCRQRQMNSKQKLGVSVDV